MTTPKIRTITLTNRRPVQIDEDAWPVLVFAKLESPAVVYGTLAPARIKASLYARRHADGRVLVYGVSTVIQDSRPAQRGASVSHVVQEEHRAGELLYQDGGVALQPSYGDIIAALRRVAKSAHISGGVAQHAIAQLPPERL